MQAAGQKIEKDLVLLGGGHAHLQVVKSFGMRPEPGVRVTLVSPEPHTPYSGMLPGLIAGHYAFDDTHIDLVRLCRWAGARFICGQADGLNLAAQTISLIGRPPLGYDLLSIDTGSTPRADDVPGVADFATPVKPISKFLTHWQTLRERALKHPGKLRIAFVGAGAGGVELLLAVKHALETAVPGRDAEFHLFSRGGILPAESDALRAHFTRLLQQRGVRLHLDEAITAVEKGVLRTAKGGRYEAEEILWVTAAGAPRWPRASGLATDEAGFIAVSQTLQSTSHERVFAAGDVAAMIHAPRPKAGVFAVRQGPVLARNLRQSLQGQPLESFRPQSKFLKILATGGKNAVASRGAWILAGDLIWQWKDRIDRRFMAKFNELPERMPYTGLFTRLCNAFRTPELADDEMRCGGCGAKIGSELLKRVLAGITPHERSDVLLGLDAPDDAAALLVPDGKVSVHTVDAFRAMIDDPWLFGAIAANHALGDIYAMGAEPQAAMAIVTIPPNAQSIVERDLSQIMRGAVGVLNAAGAALVGGHTAEGAETTLGFSMTGLADSGNLLRKSGLRDGDVLILTKALGTGALLAADMRARARGRDVRAAIASMQQSNAQAARIIGAHGATALTDVTGFGLAGHLMEMLRASRLSAQLDLAAIPALNGALDAMQTGIFSTLHPQNAKLMPNIDHRLPPDREIALQLLFDPQTAAGLLASMPRDSAEKCVGALREAGYLKASIIGCISTSPDTASKITII